MSSEKEFATTTTSSKRKKKPVNFYDPFTRVRPKAAGTDVPGGAKGKT